MYGTVRNMRYMDEACYVYVLINPENRRPFYIGISNNPWYRFEAHRKEPWSAAFPALRILLKDGLFHRDEILKIYKKCETRSEALEIEYRLVVSTTGLLNRPYKRGKSYT